MAKALAIVKTEEPKPKPKRERIQLIESTPQEDWFVRTTTIRGRVVWYLRFEMTGRNSRLYGPFPSKRQGLLFLDEALDAMTLEGDQEMADACWKRRVTGEFQAFWPPIIEYPVLTQLRSASKKGR